MIGRKRKEIEDEIKELELQVQFNKVLKGLAEVMFRSCIFKKPGNLEPERIRSKVFLSAPNGVFDISQKNAILSKIAKEEGCSEDNILYSLYSDLEDEEILSEMPEISEDELCRRFNLEQVETLLMRAVSLSVSGMRSYGLIVSKIRSLDLMYRIGSTGNEIQNIWIEGPASVIEESKKYSTKFAGIIRYLLSFDEWEIDSEVELSRERKKERFRFHLDSSSRFYFPDIARESDSIIQFPGIRRAEPIFIGSEVFIPDYVLERDDQKAIICLSRPNQKAYNDKWKKKLEEIGLKAVFVYIIKKGEKKLQNEICFFEKLDWDYLLNFVLADPESRKRSERMQSEIVTPKIPNLDELRKKIDLLYPDSDEMIEAIVKMHLDVEDTLTALGYKVYWSGLQMAVRKKK